MCFNDIKKIKNKKFNMFLVLCVFDSMVGYDVWSMWNNFWDGRKYEQPNENSSRLCTSYFYKVINKTDFEEMSWWSDEVRFLKKDLMKIFILFLNILKNQCGGFRGRWKRSCENEVCRSLFFKEVRK
jgi:hypothetical protein